MGGAVVEPCESLGSLVPAFPTAQDTCLSGAVVEPCESLGSLVPAFPTAQDTCLGGAIVEPCAETHNSSEGSAAVFSTLEVSPLTSPYVSLSRGGMISRSSNPENGNSSSDGANHNSGGDEGDGSHRDRDGRFPLAIPQAGHRVNRSKGSGKGSADDPSAAQSGSEKEHSDYPNSFHTVNDGSKQPFRRSATAAAKQNSDRFTASLEETTSQKELGVARKRKSSFCSSTTSEFPPDEIWATSKPSSVGAALPGSPPPAPHNWSLQALNNEAVSTMPPIMRVFAGNVEQQQPMSSVSFTSSITPNMDAF